jgi:hypothetical protein
VITIECTYPGMGQYALLVWALVCIGYLAGLALHRLPSPGGSASQWGGQLMSYSLVTAGILAIIGSGDAVTNLIINRVISNVPAAPLAGDKCQGLPEMYANLGIRAFSLLSIMTGIGMGTSLIPIVGPAIANIFSVVSTVPGLALSVTLITAFTLMVFITVFGSLAVALAPLGIALIAVPGGKAKGIGSWLVAAAIVFAIMGPFIPVFGLKACEAGMATNSNDQNPNPNAQNECDIGELTQPLGLDDFKDVFSLVTWMFNPSGNPIMAMWRFALGSLAGWGILMAASAALSKGMGGVAASLGFG